MSNAVFREKIREKIADESLQKALDANADRRVQSRTSAWHSLPDWRERRNRAHTIRADVIDHLDQYLSSFIEKATSNGIQVHRAADAQEANRIVLSIAGSRTKTIGREQLLFAKSKSMVSEEIGLNHALEAAGHRVVETDLGEYIIQLRGERPGHIITPAVHLRRHQVAQLFLEKLGLPYTEDIPTLTNTARKVLRDVFFTADVGISGVNFGIAETGTLTLVTNEGNGRMCTNLPPVHIALMGMERLLPSMSDLALMLSLLPRSATGQKLSVYTQFMQSPVNGQQKHLVIVNNGRSRVRSSSLKESLLCIRCGSCLNACPVFREIGGHAYVGTDGSIAPYPGPIGSVISPGLMGVNYSQLADASTLCGACRDACPIDIDLPGLILRVRSMQADQTGRLADTDHAKLAKKKKTGFLSFFLGLFSKVASHPELFSFGQNLVASLRLLFPGYIPLPAFTGWGTGKDLPSPAARSFNNRYHGVSDLKNVGQASPVQRMITEIPDIDPVLQQTRIMDLPERFASELTAVGAQVIHTTPDELTSSVAGYLLQRELKTIQAWDSILSMEPGSLEKCGISCQTDFSPAVKAGLTGVLAGLADTGSLLLAGSAAQPLSPSLLPEIHLAVINADQILPTMDDALRLPQVTAAPSSVLITGPSRTADIEMTLTIGVHGPCELIVFLVDGSARR